MIKLFQEGLMLLRFNDEHYIAQYMGKQRGFDCIVCGKGENCHTFNIYNDINDVETGNYETWGFGPDHIKELEFINNINCVKYAIYQLPITSNECFRPYNKEKFDFSDYEKVYVGNIGAISYAHVLDQLWDMFQRDAFNSDIPEDYKNRSMSMSDIIYLKGEGFYFCDDFGWTKLEIIEKYKQ